MNKSIKPYSLVFFFLLKTFDHSRFNKFCFCKSSISPNENVIWFTGLMVQHSIYGFCKYELYLNSQVGSSCPPSWSSPRLKSLSVSPLVFILTNNNRVPRVIQNGGVFITAREKNFKSQTKMKRILNPKNNILILYTIILFI